MVFDSNLIDDYKIYLTDVRKASTNTVTSYIRDVKRFADYLSGNDKDDFDKITGDDIRYYLLSLEKSKKSPATMSRCIASLKAFFNHMIILGHIKSNPVSDISVSTVHKKPPRILTDKEIRILLDQPNVKDPKGCRDKAMLEVLYATGIRVSELINLDMTDINLTTGLVSCRNGKDRIVPMHESAVKAVTQYLTFARPKLILNGEIALFVNTNGERMTRQGFWKILKSYSEQAKIDGDITPQMLRNSFAAHLLENGANIKTLQEILGHAGISSTQVYARVVKHKLKDVYSKAHPMAK